MIRLLIADDHEVIRFGLQLLLGGEPDITVIGVAAEGRTAVAMAVADRPDVVLMDLSMPMLDGVAATREIMRAAPSAKVLVHTAYAHASIIREAFAAGAAGYLLKDSSPTTLPEAIRAVHRGESPMAPVARDVLYA
jgi:DNA-binding NarL/FixJ family response regulator